MIEMLFHSDCAFAKRPRPNAAPERQKCFMWSVARLTCTFRTLRGAHAPSRVPVGASPTDSASSHATKCCLQPVHDCGEAPQPTREARVLPRDAREISRPTLPHPNPLPKGEGASISARRRSKNRYKEVRGGGKFDPL